MAQFTAEQIRLYRKLGLESTARKLVAGFNFYPTSIEQEFSDSVIIPVKYAHRKDAFASLLENAVKNEFKDAVKFKKIPRKTVHQWLKSYLFPAAEENIKLFDVIADQYIQTEADYRNASSQLIAEADEYSLLFIPSACSVNELARFILLKGSFFVTDNLGKLVRSDKNENRFPFKLNPNRISDDAYITPMIITSYKKELADLLPEFKPVKKLYKICGSQEISVYLDKTYNQFKEFCKIGFDGPAIRLANKLFRDFINFEEDPRLADIF